ncbi:hypothetical protein GSI_07783 [Ganoderma sinense ZZ0214-1]|uniref:Uncharacterized protein n=1 Tax=Ganoderma sinense ZZ0214-1 TaxID=1077348 RepID=A0A2G8S8X3_9APHY|nr:hypothetical protein GSI_07651 [Ganoderma sinense ZZ0214-1]PIL30205.1 hypothetical protein GSI_07783 [Ganoderma sinense ZZ0214-1]
MAPPLLNVDVLAVACEFLTDVSDVLAMALTSSSLHPVALSWLLRMRPVYLNGSPAIRRFHLFLFADESTRAPHIRALHIDLRQPTPAQNQDEDGSLLVHILSSCKHLEHLTVAFHQFTLPIVAEPSFLHTVNAISSLQSFSVRSTSHDGISLLPSFRTPLRRLSIHTDNVTSSPRYPADLNEFLSPAVMPTLEMLELDRFAVDPLDAQVIGNHLMTPSFTMAPYAAVRSLSHLFPALDGTLNLDGLHLWASANKHDEIRAANQRVQDGDGGRAWRKLDRVVCGAPAFYVLALRCPIRLAMIHCGSVENYHFAAVALRENPVPRLKLTLYHEPGMFAGLFSAELAERLTHLTLCVLYSKNYEYSPPGQSQNATPQFQWDDVFATLVTAIRPLHRLTHLRVVIGASVYVHKEASWPRAPWGEYAHSFRGSRFDFGGTAATLARGLPSLQYVFITTGGFLTSWVVEEDDPEEEGRWKLYERWYVGHGWRVAAPGTGASEETGEGPGLVELHEDVAETIIRREELVLSERDERSRLNSNHHLHYHPTGDEIYLRSGPSVRRFHSFLRADARTRSPYVRAIHIDLRQPEEPQALADDLPLFLDILNTCKRIEHITLAFREVSRHVAEDVDPRIVQAITDTPCLRSFSIRSRHLNGSTDTLALLLHLSAPLSSLGILSQNEVHSFWYPAALERFLPRVARTLENLKIATFTVDPLVIQAGTHASSLLTASLTKYSAVRSLSVGSLEGQPLLEDLQHLFPALDSTLSLGTLDARCKKGTYDHIRAVNQRAQEPNGDGSPARPWTRLDRVVCSGRMLYVLGLRCPIRLAMLDFNDISEYRDAGYVYVHAAVALRENPVPRLKLTLGHDVASGALDEMLSPELALTLTHLTLCLLYSDSEFDREKEEDAASDPRDRWENVLDGLISAIRPLRNLTHLRVVLGVTGYVDEDTLGPLDEYAYSFRASTFDFEGTAAALARALPSLQNVFIATTGRFSIWEWQRPDLKIGGSFKPYERWYASRGWRVAMHGPGEGGVPEGERGKGIVELHEDVAETIVRKEELVLSERDEKRLKLNHGWHRSPPPLLRV